MWWTNLDWHSKLNRSIWWDSVHLGIKREKKLLIEQTCVLQNKMVRIFMAITKWWPNCSKISFCLYKWIITSVRVYNDKTKWSQDICFYFLHFLVMWPQEEQRRNGRQEGFTRYNIGYIIFILRHIKDV